MSRIYKEHRKLNSENKTNNSIRMWAKDMKRHFIKEDIQMANKYIKRYSALLAIGLSIKMAEINNSDHTNFS